MAIKIKNTKDIEIDGVKCVVYGGAGVGKTRLCATAPSPIIISAESGLLSTVGESIDYIEISTLSDLDEAYNYLKNNPNYKTICLDSLSEICENLVEKVLPEYKDARQAYAQLSRSVIPMLKRFRDLKSRHILFTSKLKRNVDEETSKVTEDLLLPGQVLSSQVPYLVDELFCLQIDRKGNAFLQTAPDRVRFCKDRSGALLPQEAPDMTAIINKILANKTDKFGD
jgi:hypothetical protein